MTETLTADVAIIGGGTAGCSAALWLRRRGMSVVLLEKGWCGSGASGVNFGGVRQQGRDLAELPISTRAREIWARLPEIVGEDCEFRPTGHMKLARTEADMATMERYAKDAAEYGLKLQMLGANAVRQDSPWVGTEVVGASLCTTDGQANSRLVAPAFARAARAAGADIREQTRVVSSAFNGEQFETVADKGALVVRSRWLINCAGAWASRIAAWFGENVILGLIIPNEIVTEPLPRFIDRSFGVCGGDVYLRQVERGNVIFGGGPGWGDIEAERSRARPETIQATFRKAVGLVPGLKNATIIRTWSGFDGSTSDHIPVLGYSSTTERLVHAFGFSGHGFQLGPVVGEVLAELVADGDTPTPIEAFSISRFTGAGAQRY